MPDRGARYADKSIVKVTRSLKKTYAQAQKELESKLKDFNSRFKAKDKEKQKQRDAGEITEQQYKDWLSGQVFIRNQWESKIRQVNAVMLDYNKQAMNIVNNSRFDVFAENYYSEAFRAQWIVNDLSWNVYNSQALAQLIKDDPQILPEWKIDEEKDYKWNYQKVNNIIKQGIIQGESVDQITKRLCTDLSSMNENKMRMFARTGITEAQNSGRQEQMRQAAEELDIEQEKEWQATFDNRTRDAHRHLDGQRVPWKDSFQSDLGEIRYPGDPTADPANVYNCRCTMKTIYPKYEDRSKNFRENVTIDGQSYEEWKEGKKSGRSSDQKFTTNYNTSEYKDVEVSPELKQKVDNTINKALEMLKPLQSYFKEVEFTKEDGIGSAFRNGTGIRLDKKVFSDPQILQKEFNKLVQDGHTVNATDPMFVVAHEIGHCLENMVVYKQLHLNPNSVIGELQNLLIIQKRHELEILYYANMGFGNESKEQIYDTIDNEMGWRARQSGSELVAQAMGQVMFGIKPTPHAQCLIDYLLKLAEE